LATIIHRRPARSVRPTPPRGPGGTFWSLTRVGWLFAALGAAWLAWSLRFLLDLGDPVQWSWAAVLQQALTALRGAAVVAMPAALELGVPAARRRTPWLYRGLVLLAIEQLARPVLTQLQQLAFENLGPDSLQPSFAQPILLVLVLLSLAVTLLAVAGTWSLSDGLADAGARPRRWVLGGVVAAGAALSAFVYVPGYGFFTEGAVIDPTSLALWINVISIILGLIEIALWIAVAVRLVYGGATRRLRPKEAWLYGAIAGLFLLVIRVVYPVVFLAKLEGDALAAVLNTVAAGPWIFLFIAFVAGLGRGRERREERPSRVRLFIRHPTS